MSDAELRPPAVSSAGAQQQHSDCVHYTAGDLSVHSRLTHDSEDGPETPRGWPGSERTLDPGQASPAAAGGRRPTLGYLSITGNHHHEVRDRTAHCNLTSGSRAFECHPGHTWQCRTILATAPAAFEQPHQTQACFTCEGSVADLKQSEPPMHVPGGRGPARGRTRFGRLGAAVRDWGRLGSGCGSRRC